MKRLLICLLFLGAWSAQANDEAGYVGYSEQEKRQTIKDEAPVGARFVEKNSEDTGKHLIVIRHDLAKLQAIFKEEETGRVFSIEWFAIDWMIGHEKLVPCTGQAAGQ